jgi:hypothetical protein
LAYRPTRVSCLSVASAALLAFTQSCSDSYRGNGQDRRIDSVYNKKTGRLELLKFDSDGDGKFDTFSYMDGSTVLRIEIDRDEDGKIDRWEYYGPGKSLERVALSRAQNGVADTWQFFDGAGVLARVEIAEQGSSNKGRAERIEYYEKGVMIRAEEDTDHDGRIDKWETYDGSRLASVAFDERGRGAPTRRILYAPDGAVRIEVDAGGDGHFVEQSSIQKETRQSR